MRIIKIFPQNPRSQSARALARALDCKRIRFDGSFWPTANHLVINWGNARTPGWWRYGLNPPVLVGLSSNKLLALNFLWEKGVQVPEFTTDVNVAQQWFNSRKIVVGRAVLNGHGGIGIKIFTTPPSEFIALPLYTKHLRHKDEFRVHVFKGTIIDVTQKKRSAWHGPAADNLIRSHENGWVFCREDIRVPEAVLSEAVKAVDVFGLDFGAVDVAYRKAENQAFVLEINTAPGLEGTTIESYAKAILEEAKNS